MWGLNPELEALGFMRVAMTRSSLLKLLLTEETLPERFLVVGVYEDSGLVFIYLSSLSLSAVEPSNLPSNTLSF